MTLTTAGDELIYRAPVGALTAPDKQELAARRAEVIRYVRAAIAARKPPFDAGRHSPAPSLTQQLWWRQIKAMGSQPGDCLRLQVPFNGVDACAAVAAIRQVIARHEALRYRFSDSLGSLLVSINPAEDFSVATLRLAAEPAAIPACLHATIARLESAVIPAEGPWLTVATVVMRTEREGVIAIGLHHIISDATSLLIIKNELEGLLSPGTPALEQDAPLQFSQYAAWEASWFNGERAHSLAAYWTHWMASLPALRHPQTAAELTWSPGGCVVYRWACGSAGGDRLQQLAARYAATPFLVLLAIFAIALFRWSGQRRFGVLSVADGRAYGEPLGLASMVGPMVYMDPIEVGIHGAASLPAVLHETFSPCECARRLHFPLNDSQPGLTEYEFHHRVGASINYLRWTGPAERPAQHPVSRDSELTCRDSMVSHDLASERKQHDFHALQPINLRAMHQDEQLWGVLEFNESALSVPAQHELVAAFVGVLGEACVDAVKTTRPPGRLT